MSSATGEILSDLEEIVQRTTHILSVLERSRRWMSTEDHRDVRRRTLELRTKAQELFDTLSEVRLEEPTN